MKETVCFDINRFNEGFSKKIIIYGAGVYGTLLFTYLCIKGLKNSVLYFAVSQKPEKFQNLFNKPVIPFEETDIDSEKMTIIAAVSRKSISNVLKNIKHKNISDYCWFSQESAMQASKEIFKTYQEYPVKNNKVFFYCYEGMGYRCNCKYIAEKFLEDRYPVDLIWAVTSAEEGQDIPKAIKMVTIGTKEYYEELYTSSIIIENDGKDPFAYKRQEQFCINTWHGYGPFKKVNGALLENDKKKMREYYSYYDLFLTASTFYSQVYRDSFCFEGEIMECGAPRNDIFFKQSYVKEKIHNLYHIPPDMGIVLWAPTFRYDKFGAFDQYDFDIVQVLDAIKEKFQRDYVVMYRFHHQLYNAEKRVGCYTDGIDVTLYTDIQELLTAADICITDYSSLMWDFSLQRKPVFLFQKDLKDYIDRRGFYAPVSEWPYPRAHTERELLETIKNFDDEQYICQLNSFLENYGSCDDGHAAERVVKRIMDRIGEQSDI